MEVIRDNSRVILQAKSCSEIQPEVNKLSIWSKSTDNSCEASTISVSGSPCKADVSKCIPKVLLENHYRDDYKAMKFLGPGSDFSGPNCWNFALMLSGILPALRFTPPEEMTYFMNSEFCQPVKNINDREPGDIGVIRANEDNKEMHAFVYISDKLALTKNGPSRYSPYLLQSTEEIQKIYKYESKCSYLSKTYGSDIEKCKGHVEYFRCSSLDEYLEKETEKISTSVKEVVNIVDNIECNISKIFFDQDLLSVNQIDFITTIAESLSKYLEDELGDLTSKTEEEKIILSMIDVRLKALAGNTRYELISTEKTEPDEIESLNSLTEVINISIQQLEGEEISDEFGN